VLALAGALSGCAPRATTRPPLVVGYATAFSSLPPLDVSPLRGRRVAIDPGHGGLFPGALGKRGLTEAEVNLAVALHLRDRLAAAGAEVMLTRDADRDFLTPADSSLRSDLAERVRLANDFAPDAFVSIHHNASPTGRRDVNETLTFYRLEDDGPSRELAEHVHRALVGAVGIRPHRVVPGNFAVLRGSSAPAILTETSYLTQPKVERRLVKDDARRLEAEAIARGLAAFFARGAPALDSLVAESVEGGVRLHARVRGGFDHVDLRVHGAPVTPRVAGDRIEWESPADAPAGPGEATLRVALAGAGTSATVRARFTIERPWNAFYLEAELWPRRLPPGGGLAAARLLAVDAWGGRAPAGHEVRVVALDSTDAPRDTVLRLADGEAWLPLRVAPRGGRGVATYSARVIAPPHAAAYPPEAPIVVPIGTGTGPAAVAALLRGVPGDTALRPLPRDAVERGRPRRLAVRFPRAAGDWLTPLGIAELPLDSAGRAVAPRLPGYRPLAPDSAAGGVPDRWVAVAGGALHGRRIAIDADGGGEAAGGTGEGGARASALNLEVARALAAMLESAGAEVRLVRDADVAVPDVDRVLASERFRAERYLRIGHRAEPPRLGHYFSSAAGRRWAERTARELARLGLPAPPPADDAQVPIQQVAATALYAGLARIDDPRSEARLLGPGAVRAEAYALYLGLAREWAGDAWWPLDSIEVRDAAGRPVARAAVRLGDALVLETDALGRVRFARTEPGPIQTEVDDPRVRARARLLDSDRAAVLTGPAVR
jgi:N-acetylmuramoyl-L-alanine amidase